MKITAIESVLLRVPTPKPIALEFPHQGLVVALIHTDQGLTGLGYSLASPTMTQVYGPHVEGHRLAGWGGAGGSLVLNDLDARMTVAFSGTISSASAHARTWTGSGTRPAAAAAPT